MRLKYLYCIFFLIPGGIVFSQDSFDNNLAKVNALIDESFTAPSNKLLLLGKDNFYEIVYDPGDQVESYIVNLFRSRFIDYKLILNEDADSIDYKIFFNNTSILTDYKKIFTDKVLGTKKLEREVTVSYDMVITERDSSKIIYKQNFSKKSKDNIDLDKLGYADDKRYQFSSSNLPEESTLNQILFPALIITISAAAIILFFTIRSK